MASFSEEDIKLICDQIFEKLEVNYELDDLGILLEENIYIELYRIMFPYLEQVLVEIAARKARPAQKIQELINLLSSTVLNMDLSHIKGEHIAKGDKKHILNFLQLIFEVIKLLPPVKNREVAMHSAPITNDSSSEASIRRRTVQAIPDEFPSMNFDQEQENLEQDNQALMEQDKEPMDREAIENLPQDFPPESEFHDPGEPANLEDYPNLESEMLGIEHEEELEQPPQVETSKNVIKEVPKSEESSEYDKAHYGLSDKRKSSGKGSDNHKKDLQDKKMQRDKSKKNLVDDVYSQKQVHKKLIGETLFAGQKTNKVLQKDSNIDSLKTKKLTKVPEEGKIRQLLESSGQSEGKENVEKSHKSKESEKRSSKEVDQNAEFLKFNENMYEILADNIEKIRESLRNMKKTNLSEEDQKTKEELIRQKNEYKRLLKEYLQYHRQKESKAKTKAETDEKYFLRKVQHLQSKDTCFQQAIESEEKGLYMKLRDEKINYLRKIHRIIFELEKRKIIDENKQYKENRKLRNEETRYVLESIENAYKDKIDILKEKLVAQRKEKSVSEAAHRQVLSKLERELKQEKQRQLSELKNAWKCEKEKFDLLVMDDGKLEQKIMALYNKY